MTHSSPHSEMASGAKSTIQGERMVGRGAGKFAYLILRCLNGQIIENGHPKCEFGRRPELTASWKWDGTHLEVRSDEFGFRPLFYWGNANSIIVSESVNPILQTIEDPTLDLVALSVFLRIGCFLGEDTPFLGIRQLEPNSILTWSSVDGLRIRTGPRPSANVLRGTTRTCAVRTYTELFQKSIEQTIAGRDIGRLVVPLSGGRDSRHIAFALDSAGTTPSAYVSAVHLPWKNDEDVRIAKLVAEALGGRHIVVPQPRFFLANCVNSIRETGFLGHEHAWQLPVRDWIIGNADTIIDGIAGDMMSGGLYQTQQLHQDFKTRNFKAIADQLFAHSTLAGWEGIVAPELNEALSPDVAYTRLLQELELHLTHHNPARSFYFWNRTRRQIALAPFCVLRGVRVATPYLDLELWSFLDSLPFDIVADHTFHDETICRAYPALAHIPYENKHAPRPFGRTEPLGIGVDFLRLLPSFTRAKGINWLRMIRRGVGSLRDHRLWWNQSGALYLLALLDVPNLKLR